MASASGRKLRLKVGDGESPEEFTAFCSITSRSVTYTAKENTFDIPDCDEPDDVMWTESEIMSVRIAVDGSGVLNPLDFDAFFEWWESGESKNCELVLDIDSASGGRILTGPFKLLTMKEDGNDGDKVQISLSLASDGKVVKTNNV